VSKQPRKRTKKYVPKRVSSPVMPELHDIIAMGMHTSFSTLKSRPDENAFSMLARIVGMVGRAIEGDPRFAAERLQINSAGAALNQIGAKVGPLRATALELLPVLNAVRMIDVILPRLDVAKLHQANLDMACLK